MFGQLTSLKSLRGIILCLNAHPNSLYHLGFRTKKFTLSTVAIAKKQLKVKQNLYEILQILQVSQFEKIALFSLISKPGLHFNENSPQMSLNLAEF